MDALDSLVMKECEAIAASVLFNSHAEGLISPGEIWSSDDRVHLARALFELAKSEIENLGMLERDPNIVLRAVRYLKREAIPPHGRDTEWFLHGLAPLVVLACPVGPVGPEGEPFFDDIRRGMEEAESDEA